MSERSPTRLNKSKRKISAPPTTNSFSSSADETSGATLSSNERQKTPHERSEKEHNTKPPRKLLLRNGAGQSDCKCQLHVQEQTVTRERPGNNQRVRKTEGADEVLMEEKVGR